MRLAIKVLPRSSRNSVEEIEPGVFKIKMTSAPVDGEANKKLIELLADHFAIAKSKIKLVRGLTSKNKVVEID